MFYVYFWILWLPFYVGHFEYVDGVFSFLLGSLPSSLHDGNGSTFGGEWYSAKQRCYVEVAI